MSKTKQANVRMEHADFQMKQTTVETKQCSYHGMRTAVENDIRFDACQRCFDPAHIVLVVTEQAST
ncbi:MAG TPA: hypothetical protein VN380_06665 [Thermoanaerobaculia bacterium]|jgi:hypothetical protein|nr:hypothetical protein [Thermoanaerobaculia bacterium]